MEQPHENSEVMVLTEVHGVDKGAILDEEVVHPLNISLTGIVVKVRGADDGVVGEVGLHRARVVLKD